MMINTLFGMWNVKSLLIKLMFVDIRKLRVDFRIIGGYIGSVTDFQQQNVINGPPLILMKEEVSLLLDLGIVFDY